MKISDNSRGKKENVLSVYFILNKCKFNRSLSLFVQDVSHKGKHGLSCVVVLYFFFFLVCVFLVSSD